MSSWLTGYSACGRVAIPGSSIGSGGVSNYPAYMPLSQIPAYVTSACVDQANFTDLRVTLDDGTTVLNLDRSGAVGELWFSVPSWLSSATNYVRFYSGNAGAGNMTTAEQQAVWDANYLTVHHLNDSAFPLADSTANGIGLSALGTPQLSQAGKLGNAVGFTGATDEAISAGNSLFDVQNWTWEGWVFFSEALRDG